MMAPPVVDGSSFTDEEEPRGKQSYRLVRLADDESSVADSFDEDSPPRWQRFLQRTILPDECFEVKGIRILDGVEVVRFLKFTVLTFVGILFVHWLVHIMVRSILSCALACRGDAIVTHSLTLAHEQDWERDTDYSLSDMMMYDSGTIILDIMSFYAVGRLYKKRGVDHLAFMLVMFLGAIYTSVEYKFKFLRYSVSLFEIHCLWPWKLWLFVGILIPLIAVIVIKHVQYAVQHGLLVSKLVEVTLFIFFFWFL